MLFLVFSSAHTPASPAAPHVIADELIYLFPSKSIMGCPDSKIAGSVSGIDPRKDALESSMPIFEKKLSSSCEDAAVCVSLEPINPNLYGLKPSFSSILIPSNKASRT